MTSACDHARPQIWPEPIGTGCTCTTKPARTWRKTCVDCGHTIEATSASELQTRLANHGKDLP